MSIDPDDEISLTRWLGLAFIIGLITFLCWLGIKGCAKLIDQRIVPPDEAVISQISMTRDQRILTLDVNKPAIKVAIGDQDVKISQANRGVIAREIERTTNEDEALYNIIQAESGWQVGVINPISGSCGLGQALPCSKMGEDCLGNYDCELQWTKDYIQRRYGSAIEAWEFWQEQYPHWY